ncbi:MAG: hypothetical protein ACUVUD_02430 [bacterium]
MVTFLSLALLVAQPSPQPGFLTVHSIPPQLPVFVAGDSIGLTPLDRHRLDPGSYWVTVVSNDSLEVLYYQLRSGALNRKLTALWTLARIYGATSQVEVLPGMETKISIDRQTMEKNACRAKRLFAGAVGGIFTLGVVCGIIIGVVAR